MMLDRKGFPGLLEVRYRFLTVVREKLSRNGKLRTIFLRVTVPQALIGVK